MKLEIIVLAAGQSRRFGVANKLLALFKGEPLVVGAVRRMTQVRVASLTLHTSVVTRAFDDEVARALAAARYGVRIVPNARAAEGIGTSVAAGIASLSSNVGGAVVMPGDLPFVQAALVEALIAAFSADGGRRPVHPVLADGTQINPVVWPRAYFDTLTKLGGDRGAKGLLAQARALGVAVANPLIAADIDTPEDLVRLTRSIGTAHSPEHGP